MFHKEPESMRQSFAAVHYRLTILRTAVMKLNTQQLIGCGYMK